MFGTNTGFLRALIDHETACRRELEARISERIYKVNQNIGELVEANKVITELRAELSALYNHLGIKPKELSGITFVKED